MSGQGTETPILDLLESMTLHAINMSDLDPQTLTLVRLAALVAVDAPTTSYLLNLGMAGELDLDAQQVRAVLAAIAPIVGTARTASALGKIGRALGLALDFAEAEAEREEG
jgi:hypothetical protein